LSRDRFRDQHGGSALPWLLRIARNVLRETVRLDRVETRARERLRLPVDLAAEDGYAKVDERLSPRLALAAALDGLPEHERQALELRVVGELSYDEVAGRLEIRPEAARLRVSRAPATPGAHNDQRGGGMSSLPESLVRFRTELEDAIRRELEARATARSNGRGARVLRAVGRRPGRTTLAVAAVAGAVAAALFVSSPWKTSPGFLERAQAALTHPRRRSCT
jgi:RNA polymerase sigma-70 factor (ECF subfamily)